MTIIPYIDFLLSFLLAHPRRFMHWFGSNHFVLGIQYHSMLFSSDIEERVWLHFNVLHLVSPSVC